MNPNDQLQLLLIRGLIASLPDEQKAQVDECAARIRQTVADYGDAGIVAASLIAAELAAEVLDA